MRFRLADALVTGVVAMAGMVAGAPRRVARDHVPTVSGLVTQLQQSDLVGRQLADAAVVAVGREFPYHSVWHLWESPTTALANGRGWSHQYNTVLLEVLRGLGFEARGVHAARVRGWGNPWFFASHNWVKVKIDGRWLDACASRSWNRVGQVGFTPVTDELDYRSSTPYTVGLTLLPFVVIGVWRAWLTGRPVSPWIYRRRD